MGEHPFLQVVRGEPTAEELAALVAALTAGRHSAASADSAGGRARRRSLWADPSRLVRRPAAPGPGAWRASAFPH